MDCPRCAKPLAERSIDHIVIHVCPQCSGGLYEPENLDFDCVLEPSRETAAVCPACAKHFDHGPLKGTGVPLAKCSGCGRVWLDLAQGPALRQALGKDGFLKAAMVNGTATSNTVPSEPPHSSAAVVPPPPPSVNPNGPPPLPLQALPLSELPARLRRYKTFGGWLTFLQVSYALALLYAGVAAIGFLVKPLPVFSKCILLVVLAVPSWINVKFLRVMVRASPEIPDRLASMVILSVLFSILAQVLAGSLALLLLIVGLGGNARPQLAAAVINAFLMVSVALVHAAIWVRYFMISQRVLIYYGTSAKPSFATVKSELEAFFWAD